MANPPPMSIDVDALYKVTITTDKGDIVMQLDPKLAPNSVNNFVALARQAGVRFGHVPRATLTAIAGTPHHQGVVARVAALEAEGPASFSA